MGVGPSDPTRDIRLPNRSGMLASRGVHVAGVADPILADFCSGLKFYKDRYLRHPIVVEFGYSQEQTPTYRRRPTPYWRGICCGCSGVSQRLSKAADLRAVTAGTLDSIRAGAMFSFPRSRCHAGFRNGTPKNPAMNV